MVSKVAEEDTEVDYYYVDVDDAPDIAPKLGISSIPTLVLFKEGHEANRSVGAISADRVKQFAHS